jgi:hypothetical protein
MTRDELNKIARDDAGNLKAKNAALAKWRLSLGDDIPTEQEERGVMRKLDGLAEDSTPLDAKLASARAQDDTVAVVFCEALQAVREGRG